MVVENLSSEINIREYLKKLGVDAGGVGILSKKAKIHTVSIKDLNVGAANILKQDALSIGADLAVPRGTVLAKSPYVDTLLIATTSQLKILSQKELKQPFGLKDLALKLKAISEVQTPKKVEIMGIINANDDSFFSDSRFNAQGAIKKIESMIDDGATIIDIGGVSSAPNAKSISAEEELLRVKPILDLIKAKKLYEKASFSIDSYAPLVIEYALESHFAIVNDITGLESDEVCKLCSKYKAKVVIMHMQGKPETMQINPKYQNILDDVYSFLAQRVEKAKKFGIEDILLDIGIGFGKSVDDNFQLIRNLEHFMTLGYPLLVGASRKSMIGAIDNSKVQERLSGTLTLHIEAMRNGASVLRVHDVYEHAQSIKIQEKLNTI